MKEREMANMENGVKTAAAHRQNGDEVFNMEEIKLRKENKSKAAFLPKPKVAMYLTFEDVCCYVPAQFEIPSFVNNVEKAAKKVAKGCTAVAKRLGMKDKESSQTSLPKERQILYSITGCVNPGEVVAIMGPSGSGKTTFISLLAGRNHARHTGSILYNNTFAPTDKSFKRRLGYVMQEDALYEGLTVYETLYYTAVLRLPRTLSDKEKRERVDIIMECLGITGVKNSIIGGFRVGRRGISGGEKKRVAIGQELLYNPSVILLDEPTSGLDSTTALSLIHTLHTLAQVGNRTIVTTIHQPSSRIYQMLDKLLLMGLGRVLFFGDASLASTYFGDIGYPMPYGMNPADFLLDLASGWSGDTDIHAYTASDPQLSSLLSAIESKPFKQRESPYSSGDIVDLTPEGGSMNLWRSRSNADSVADLDGPSFFTQCRVIAIRSVRDRRFERFNGDTLFILLFMAIICGVLWFQKGRGASLETFYGALDVTAILFFTATFLSFNVMFSGIFTFPSEKTLMMKERASGMYPISAFFFGRTLADLPLDVGPPLVVTTIIYIMVGLKPTVPAFLLTLVVLLLTCFVAGSLGLLIGAWFLNMKRAQSAATVVMLTIMLAGGFFVRDIPVWMSWIQYVSYIMYAWNALVTIHLKGRVLDCADLAETEGAACENTLLDGMSFNVSVGEYIGILLAMLVILRFCVYLALRVGAKE